MIILNLIKGLHGCVRVCVFMEMNLLLFTQLHTNLRDSCAKTSGVP